MPQRLGAYWRVGWLLAWAGLLASASASTWERPANCTTECDAAHTCISNLCSTILGSCPVDLVQTGSAVQQPDMSDCFDNGCGLGGCPVGTVETSSEQCYTLGVPTSRRETCCKLKPQVTCCKRLNCTLVLADCRIPQQQSLPNPSKSIIHYMSISDGSSEQFPFYWTKVAPPGSSCDDQRVWGRCQCVDGTPSPGCLLNDSSTWFSLLPLNSSSEGLSPSAPTPPTPQTPSQAPPGPLPPAAAPSEDAGPGGSPSAERLPPNLSLTCVEQVVPAGNPLGPGPMQRPEKSKGSKGAMIALIVVSSVLGALLLALLVGALLLLRKPAPDTWVEGRLASVYEPVFTGASYNPVPKTRGGGAARWSLPSVRDVVGGVKQLLGRRTAAYDEVNAGQQAYSSHRAKLEARFAQRYSLSQPAQPPDAEDEEEEEEHGLYTLEDLEPTYSYQQQRAGYGHYTTGSSAGGTRGYPLYTGGGPVPEVELGAVKEAPAHAAIKVDHAQAAAGLGGATMGGAATGDSFNPKPNAWHGGASMGTSTPALASPTAGHTGFSASAGNTGSSRGGHSLPYPRGVILTTPVNLEPPPPVGNAAPSPQHTGGLSEKHE